MTDQRQDKAQTPAVTSGLHATLDRTFGLAAAGTSVATIALAPGMGLNAYFALHHGARARRHWQLALALVFLSGALFQLISLTPLSEWLINAIPMNLNLGIAAGIGLFLALIGLQNAGLVAADATTLVKLGDLTQAKALLAVVGFLLIAGLAARKVPGAIIFGVIAVMLAAVWLGIEP